ncbi:8356_t:CDS:10 [Paraglomus brasilianum]|uniref:8356_t:CDS:1 n=1 Tax=Paraglomus brasilianum TaxID=144538 RepID=A0A9N9FU37_9GLOM|nr:8356_t:CDS:10 [Paraglomus brasilianum]
MGNTDSRIISSSGSSGSGGPVRPTPDDYDKRRLTNLYNTPVESAQVFKRKLLTGGSLPFVYHEGIRITINSGAEYLIHSTDASGAQVVTEARHMSNNWDPVGEVLVPRGNQTVGDLMKTARRDGGYILPIKFIASMDENEGQDQATTTPEAIETTTSVEPADAGLDVPSPEKEEVTAQEEAIEQIAAQQSPATEHSADTPTTAVDEQSSDDTDQNVIEQSEAITTSTVTEIQTVITSAAESFTNAEEPVVNDIAGASSEPATGTENSIELLSQATDPTTAQAQTALSQTQPDLVQPQSLAPNPQTPVLPQGGGDQAPMHTTVTMPAQQPTAMSEQQVQSDAQQPIDYKAVPPPPSLTSNSDEAQFNDAMARVRAIAAKLQQQQQTTPSTTTTVASAAETPSPSNSHSHGSNQGVKRPHDDSYVSHSSRDKRDDHREDYRRDSHSRRERNRYDDYGRESKRATYDSGSSRSDYESGSRHRYGLGSEERHRQHGSHYGPGDSLRSGHILEEFSVPNVVVGLVIGRGGENLKRIEKTTGARVQFSQDQPPDCIDRRVSISGPPEEVRSARSMIRSLVDDALASQANRRGDYGPSRATVTIHIPSSKVGVVIGRGGETIRDLQDRSGARINVTPDNAANPQSTDRPVTLIGDDAAIQRAKALIDEIIKGGDAALDRPNPKEYTSSSYAGSMYGGESHGSSYNESHYGSGSQYGGTGGTGGTGGKSSQEKITIQVPNDTVGLIIGKGGETVKTLQQQSGAKIQIEPDHGPPTADRNVHIIGTSETVAIAKSLILEKAASGNSGSGYQQSGYQQSGSYSQQSGSYQQTSGYQQNSNYPQTSGYQQQSNYPQSSNYQQGTGYQQTSYTQNSYPMQTSQQNTYGQTNTSSGDYNPSASSGYTATTYASSGVQPSTNYSQYSGYGQTPTTYGQYQTQPQYSSYPQQSQYGQQQQPAVGQTAAQPMGQPATTGQPVSQIISQPLTQSQAPFAKTGYYPTQPTPADSNKPQGTEVKQDTSTVSAAPQYGYQQYQYNYGATQSAASQYPSIANQPVSTAQGTYSTSTTSYTPAATTMHAASNTQGTGDQTSPQPTYSVGVLAGGGLLTNSGLPQRNSYNLKTKTVGGNREHVATKPEITAP